MEKSSLKNKKIDLVCDIEFDDEFKCEFDILHDAYESCQKKVLKSIKIESDKANNKALK